MSLTDRLAGAASSLFGAPAVTSTAFRPVGGYEPPANDAAATYELLRALVDSNDAYARLRADARFAALAGDRHIRALRNPAAAFVAFYAATLWPGPPAVAHPIEADDALIEPLTACAERLWAWSNWGAKKQIAARGIATLGEQYLHVATVPDAAGRTRRVYLEVVQPDYVNAEDSERDERGYLTRFRLDVPTRDPRRKLAPVVWHTEVWDKATQEARVYRSESPPSRFEEELGAPERVTPFAALGIDFVPYVWLPFEDAGDARGVTPLLRAFEKIRELDALATSLHQALYRYNSPETYITSAVAPDGNGVPPPNLSQFRDLTAGERRFVSLPAGWDIRNDVAAVNYAEQLAAIEAHWRSLRETTLPELLFWATADSNVTESGRALTTRMKGVIAQAEEVRGNAEAGLIRAMQMAFTIGRVAGLAPFTTLGPYEQGGMDFAFAARDVLPGSEEDDLDLLATRATVMKALTDAGASIEGAALVAGLPPGDATLLAGSDLGVTAPMAGGMPAAGAPATGMSATGMPPADADLRFIDGMVPHHQSAIAMATVARGHAEHAEIARLADAIVAAQSAEIARLLDWRARWYPGAADTGGMPGMSMSPAPPADLAALAAAVPFDRAFIGAMIPHHEAAVAMARAILTTTTRPEVRRTAEGIIAAQTAEIARMTGWLAAWYGDAAPAAPAAPGMRMGGAA